MFQTARVLVPALTSLSMSACSFVQPAMRSHFNRHGGSTSQSHRGSRNSSVRAGGSNPSKDACFKSNVKVGAAVDIVLKEDQRTGRLTRGIVREILTNSGQHPHGIKVRLSGGAVGRVQAFVPKEAVREADSSNGDLESTGRSTQSSDKGLTSEQATEPTLIFSARQDDNKQGSNFSVGEEQGGLGSVGGLGGQQKVSPFASLASLRSQIEAPLRGGSQQEVGGRLSANEERGEQGQVRQGQGWPGFRQGQGQGPGPGQGQGNTERGGKQSREEAWRKSSGASGNVARGRFDAAGGDPPAPAPRQLPARQAALQEDRRTGLLVEAEVEAEPAFDGGRAGEALAARVASNSGRMGQDHTGAQPERAGRTTPRRGALGGATPGGSRGARGEPEGEVSGAAGASAKSGAGGGAAGGRPSPEAVPAGGSDEEEEEVQVYVSGLASGVTREDYGALMRSIGGLSRWKYLVGPEGCRGYGFCTVRSAGDLERVLQALGGTSLQGKQLSAKPARAREDAAAGSSRAARGGRGGGAAEGGGGEGEGEGEGGSRSRAPGRAGLSGAANRGGRASSGPRAQEEPSGRGRERRGGWGSSDAGRGGEGAWQREEESEGKEAAGGHHQREEAAGATASEGQERGGGLSEGRRGQGSSNGADSGRGGQGGGRRRREEESSGLVSGDAVRDALMGFTALEAASGQPGQRSASGQPGRQSQPGQRGQPRHSGQPSQPGQRGASAAAGASGSAKTAEQETSGRPLAPPVPSGEQILARMQQAALERAQEAAAKQREKCSRERDRANRSSKDSAAAGVAVSEADLSVPAEPIVLKPEWDAELASLRDELHEIKSMAI